MNMTREDIIKKFQNLNLWKRGGQRAAHKPLLVLYAIGKLLRGEDKHISFANAEEDLRNLLREFGPWRKGYHPHHPFWRLQNDEVWEVRGATRIRQTSSRDAYVTDLRLHGAGGFPKAIADQFQNDSRLAFEIIYNLLDDHFPLTRHSEILQAVNIHLPFQVFDTKRRSLNFRENILRAYERKCAVCGFDVKLGNTPIALEAAHIKWKSHGGPSEAVNGLALCVLHHELFDRGAFTLSKQRQILVSDDAHGTKGFKEWLQSYHGKKILPPQRQSYYPEAQFIHWHVREVFQGNYRELVIP
ncbi:restriction endonuclease [Candidatus Poribacteria bacterium]|nr:MAG: restriction endonuclease [Candidatus Poribacteria bacterium]